MKFFNFLTAFLDKLFSEVTQLGLLLISVDFLLKSFFALTGVGHYVYVAVFMLMLTTALLHAVFEGRNDR